MKITNSFAKIILVFILIIGFFACKRGNQRNDNNKSINNSSLLITKEIIPCIYESAPSFSEGLAQVKLNDKWGVIDKDGNIVAPCKYDYIGGFSEGLAKVRLNGKYGFIDKEGREVIPCEYGIVHDFSEGLALVSISFMENTTLGDTFNGWVLIDDNENKKLKLKYMTTEIRDFHGFKEGLAAISLVSRNHKYGFIDKMGREITAFKYDEVENFSEDMACVRINGKWGFINRNGYQVIDCKYDNAHSFSNGLASVYKDGKTMLIDRAGREITPLEYDNVFIHKICDGLIVVSKNRKWGFIDENFNEVIACKYDYVSSFSEGLAIVKINGLYGFVDKKGNEVISCQYSDANNFSCGFSRVALGERQFYIDKTGTRVTLEKEYDNIWDFSDGLAPVEINGKHGFISISNSEKKISQENPNYDWLIGTWEVHTPEFGNISLVILDDKSLIYKDMFETEKCSYITNGNKLTYSDSSPIATGAILIKSNQTIEFGEGYYYRKVSPSQSYTLLNALNQIEKVITKTSENSVPVRKEPNSSSEILYNIPSNQAVFINKFPTENWFKIVSYGNNSTGWIHQSSIILYTFNDSEEEIRGYSQEKGEEAPELLIEENFVTEEKASVKQIVEKAPSFPGGDKKLVEFINENLKYPPIAQEQGIQGTVIVKFAVNKSGDISNIQIAKSLDPSCDKEVIRLVKAMPKWQAGEQNGNKVEAYYTLPVKFKLN